MFDIERVIQASAGYVTVTDVITCVSYHSASETTLSNIDKCIKYIPWELLA